MASSGGCSNTSVTNSHPTFSYSASQFMSFSDLLGVSSDQVMDSLNQERNPPSWGLSDLITDRNGIEIPKFKSLTPPSLPTSPLPVSPSSYFDIPYGLLDSPAMLSSNIFPSPTPGTFAGLPFREEVKNYPEFSFQPQTRPATSSSSMFQSSASMISSEESFKRKHDGWNFNRSTEKTEVKSEITPSQSFSPVISTTQTNNHVHYAQPSQGIKEQKVAEDGYNWRKYGQKQVKGSENPRSYYKCTHPNCPTKKKLERTLDGHITEIVYKGNHNHPKPQSTRRSSSQSIQPSAWGASDISSHSITALGNGNAQIESVTTPDNSSASFGNEDFDQASPMSKSVDDDDNEPEAKRWKGENENEALSGSGSTVREPRIVVQTTSDIDILDDGYRWRKYGQKVVKGNPNPRSYYKCTYTGCPVRKHVERASHDSRAVITTYERKHNHDVPTARGSGNYTASRLSSSNGNSNVPMAIRPTAISNSNINHTSYSNSLQNTRPPPPTTTTNQAPYTLEMLHSPASFGFSRFGNSAGSYFNQTQLTENVFSKAKEEPKDDSFFESYLC